MYNLEKLRNDTPACKNLIHFNNAGAALMPNPVFNAVSEYLNLENTLGGYEAAQQAEAQINRFYAVFAKFLNAAPEEIAFIENASRAWDMAVHAIPFQAGDTVLIHKSEYAANYLGLLHLKHTKGIHIKEIPSDEHGQIDLQKLEQAITPTSKAILLTHAPSQDGLINPAEAVGQIAKKHNLIYVLDACQSCGQMPIDVQQLQCDILMGTGRKFLRGPRGTGFLYVDKARLNELTPPFVDLQAATWHSKDTFKWQNNAKRFETWERNIAGQIGLTKAVEYALDIGLATIQERINELATYLRQQLNTIDGITILDQGVHKSGIVTFNNAFMAATKLADTLRAQGVNLSSSRLEIARLDLEQREITQLSRASLHYYNTVEEIDSFCKTLSETIDKAI